MNDSAGSPTTPERLGFIVAVYILFFGCYGIANRFIQVADCFDLTTPIDSAIPFVPGFVYPFYLAYVLILMPGFFVQHRPLLIRGAIAFAALIFISCILFVIIPVHVPRPLMVPESISGTLVARIYRMDRPVCGFPSLHVSTSLLAALILLRERRFVGTLSFVFFLLTSISTLFIKQHVILDVLAGVMIALLIDEAFLQSNGDGLLRGIRAAAFNIRNMTSRPPGGQGKPFIESRMATSSGTEYDLYKPNRAGHRTFIVVTGLTLEGEHDPRLINFSRSLAESGIRTAAVSLPALKECEFDEKDVEAIIDLVLSLKEKYGGQIGIIGFSFGAGLSLIAATDPRAAGTIDPLILFGPYYSLPEIWYSILEKRNEQATNEEEWDDFIWLRMVLAYRVIDSMGLNDGDRRELVELLSSHCSEKSLQRKKEVYNRILKGREEIYFDGQTGDATVLERLSLRGRLLAIRSRVLILHDEHDNLIPPEESRRIFDELRSHGSGAGHRLLITPLISHVAARNTLRIFDVFSILGIMGEMFRKP